MQEKKQKTKHKTVKIITSLTVLALTCSLLMEQCGSRKVKKFSFYQNLKGNIVIYKNDYIGREYIDKYYVLELYHTGLERNILNIAYRFEYTNGASKYTNIFNNYFIAYDNNENDYYEFINIIPLSVFLEEYNLIKDGYSYEDMLEIYDLIRKNYVFKNDTDKTNLESNNLIKKRNLK